MNDDKKDLLSFRDKFIEVIKKFIESEELFNARFIVIMSNENQLIIGGNDCPVCALELFTEYVLEKNLKHWDTMESGNETKH